MSAAQQQPAVAVQVPREFVDPLVADILHQLDSDPRVHPSFDPCHSSPFALDIGQAVASSSLSLQ